MAYIPPIAPNARRSPSPFVRPSGLGEDVSTTAGRAVLAIDDMPPRGRVYIDDVILPDAGTWQDGTWLVSVPAGQQATSVGVKAPNDDYRQIVFPFPQSVVSQAISWNAMTSAPAPDEIGTLRVFGSPHAQVRINDELRLLQGTPSGTATLYELPVGNHNVAILAPDGFAYPVARVAIVRGQTTQLPLVRPAAPQPQPTVNPYVGIGGGPIVLPPTPIARPATGQLTVTGEPGWIVALAAAGSTIPLAPPVAIPSTGAIAVPVPVGSYNLGVQNTHGARMQAITVTAAGLAIDTRTFAATAPAATGGGTGAGTGAGAGGGAPTTSDVTVIGPAAWVLTLLLAGAETPTARMPILANGRVTFPLAAGNYKLTVDDGAGHTESRTITVPVAAPIDVSTWITGSSQQNVETGADKTPPADNLPVREVERMCGPVLNRPAWAPASMCPGDTIAGPDGNYRALAAANGVELVKLKADGTVDDSMATSTKVLIGATILGAAAVGWYFWKSSKDGKGAKVENPGKCSCGG